MMDDNKKDDKYYASQRALDKTYFSESFSTPFRGLKKRF